MASGLKTLHQIDAALRQARTAVSEAASLSQRASEALATTRQKDASKKRPSPRRLIAMIKLSPHLRRLC